MEILIFNLNFSVKKGGDIANKSYFYDQIRLAPLKGEDLVAFYQILGSS